MDGCESTTALRGGKKTNTCLKTSAVPSLFFHAAVIPPPKCHRPSVLSITRTLVRERLGRTNSWVGSNACGCHSVAHAFFSRSLFFSSVILLIALISVKRQQLLQTQHVTGSQLELFSFSSQSTQLVWCLPRLCLSLLSKAEQAVTFKYVIQLLRLKHY